MVNEEYVCNPLRLFKTIVILDLLIFLLLGAGKSVFAGQSSETKKAEIVYASGMEGIVIVKVVNPGPGTLWLGCTVYGQPFTPTSQQPINGEYNFAAKLVNSSPNIQTIYFNSYDFTYNTIIYDNELKRLLNENLPPITYTVSLWRKKLEGADCPATSPHCRAFKYALDDLIDTCSGSLSSFDQTCKKTK